MTRKDKAIQLGNAIAEHMFNELGKLCTGDVCGTHASVELFLYFKNWDQIKPEKKNELKALAYEAAKARWNELVASQAKEG